jgi:salicylate hydroxylase
VQFEAIVEEVTEDKRPSVRLASGENINADIVIGADGPHSCVRKIVISKNNAPKPTGHTIFGGIIQGQAIMNDIELKKLVKAEEVFPTSAILA